MYFIVLANYSISSFSYQTYLNLKRADKRTIFSLIMTKNPFLSAATATLYIILVALIMHFGSQNAPQDASLIGPIAGISLFTLSAAVMGYIFCYQPFILFLDGKRKEAVDLFLKTTLAFGIITAAILLLFFSGILS